ncbi:hypothetical protein KCU88_g5327, partial [Aureobasidium melanogenum]
MQRPSPNIQSSNPSVRVQQSTPTPSEQTSMLAQSSLVGGWNDGYNTGGFLSAIPKNFQDQRFHKRGSSGSSVTSGGPPSPLNHNTIYPHIVATSDSSNFPSSFDFDFNQTPHTAKSESAMMYSTNFGGPVDMRRIQSTGTDDRASYSLSAPHSASTMSHNSPATPQTTYEPEYDEKHVYGENSADDDLLFEYLQFDAGYPSAAYQQSLQDVFPDQHFNIDFSHTQQQPQQQQQQQQQQHNVPRMAGSSAHGFANLKSAGQVTVPAEFSLQHAGSGATAADLAETADISTPLFPDQSHQMFNNNRRVPSNLSTFTTPTLAASESSMQIPQQYPFVSQNNQQQDITPDFPSHLLSMESTGDEGPSEPSSQQSTQMPQPQTQAAAPQLQSQSQSQSQTQRPVDTSSDSGTYSCTYHGCHLRFESPAQLQKHKREGHKQASPTGATSPNLALRNSQAGPHRCDRINPSTGKPCNSVFSRPYDLTRHEDTIHNGRKQKVRCHLCTEEKTFSRNDALTRHMRVVHPDVNWVGKQKRKNAK